MQCLRSTWVVSGCVGLHSHHDVVIYWGDSGDGLQKKKDEAIGENLMRCPENLTRRLLRKFDEAIGKFDEVPGKIENLTRRSEILTRRPENLTRCSENLKRHSEI